VTASLKRVPALLCGPLLAVGLAACASTVSTAGFKGEDHEVAQAISNLQADATAGSERKICANDLAHAVVARLNGTGRPSLSACEQAIKNQLAEVDSFELNVHAVQVNPTTKPPTATATMKSVYAGKTHLDTVSLVKEAGKWKVSGVQ
jgi:hypothetical protein